MKWSLLELRRYKEEPLDFSETLLLEATLKKRDPEILAVAPVKVEGLITAGKNEYILHYQLETVLTLPSSRSLKPVMYPVVIEVDEVFMTREQFAVRDELVSEEEIIILDKEVIDLDESVEDNILLAIPMQLLSEDEQQSTEMPHGSGWEVITEETFQERAAQKANETIDPRLAKLSELFGDSNDPDDDKA